MNSIQELHKTRRGSQKPALDLDHTQALNKNVAASVVNLTSAVNTSMLNLNAGEVSSHSLTNTTNVTDRENINPVNTETEAISISVAQPNFQTHIKGALLAMLVCLVTFAVVYLMEYDSINKIMRFYRRIDPDINSSTQEPEAWQTWMQQVYNWVINQVHELIKGFCSQSSHQDDLREGDNWLDYFSQKTCDFAKDVRFDCFWVPEQPAPEPTMTEKAFRYMNDAYQSLCYEHFGVPEPPASEPLSDIPMAYWRPPTLKL
ncbi:uncharacterized protein [Clytia hemisphaerica]